MKNDRRTRADEPPCRQIEQRFAFPKMQPSTSTIDPPETKTELWPDRSKRQFFRRQVDRSRTMSDDLALSTKRQPSSSQSDSPETETAHPERSQIHRRTAEGPTLAVVGHKYRAVGSGCRGASHDIRIVHIRSKFCCQIPNDSIES
jgi:hypothetical protein